MKFTKMEGLGNDYVYIDGSKEIIPEEKKPDVVRFLSDRHFGIGSDGVIFINPTDAADFEMEMYNADGSRSEMCGNGIRCVAKYVYDKGLTDKTSLEIISAGKIKYIDLTIDTSKSERGEAVKARVNMGKPYLEPKTVPTLLSANAKVDTPDGSENAVISGDINVLGKDYKVTCVSVGNPHAIVFVDSTAEFPLEEVGPHFENHEVFPNRTNTEFIQILDRQNVNMRVWERGTGETMACGTGATATGVACALNGLTDESITVHLLGGDLFIEWDRKKNVVYMTGPARISFEGEIDVSELL